MLGGARSLPNENEGDNSCFCMELECSLKELGASLRLLYGGQLRMKNRGYFEFLSRE